MTTLSAVMSHVRGDISLVIRIATITEIFGHVLGIFWAYPGHILGIRNGQTGFVLVLVMVLQCDGIRFFHAPGLLRPFWSSKRVTVKRKHVHKRVPILGNMFPFDFDPAGWPEVLKITSRQ